MTTPLHPCALPREPESSRWVDHASAEQVGPSVRMSGAYTGDNPRSPQPVCTDILTSAILRVSTRNCLPSGSQSTGRIPLSFNMTTSSRLPQKVAKGMRLGGRGWPHCRK